MSDEIMQIIDQLSERLQVPAEQIWSALLVQARIEGWIGLVMPVVLSFVLWVTAWRIYATKIRGKGLFEVNEFWGIACMLAAVVAVAIAVVGACASSMSIAGLFNPEYWALKEIMYLF